MRTCFKGFFDEACWPPHCSLRLLFRSVVDAKFILIYTFLFKSENIFMNGQIDINCWIFCHFRWVTLTVPFSRFLRH